MTAPTKSQPAADRLPVTKTYKLFIDGKFPRSESGRSLAITSPAGETLAHICHASRKDLRDAATAARKALDPWRNATAYLRAQILYRMAEMLEGKQAEFIDAISAATAAPSKSRGAASKFTNSASSPAAEVHAAIDRLVAFAGWADKYAQVLGCNNAVAGPYYNFTVPEPTGVVAVVAPDSPALLGLISLLAPVICSGNTAIVAAGESPAARLTASILGEVFATSDLPAGVVNILTGTRAELIPTIASHRDIDAVHAAFGPGAATTDEARILREGAAENLKRITLREVAAPAQPSAAAKSSRSATAQSAATPLDWHNADRCTDPWWIEPFVEMKTIWHPSAV